MDKETRSAIEKATQRGRRLLEDDFREQLAGTFDVLLDGTIAAKAGAHLSPRERVQRDKIVAAIAHKRASGVKPADAVADYLRDTAFTTLNRFAALKMLEARELVKPSITQGEQSSGYAREFCGLAPGIASLPDAAGYRLYVESLFDELSTEVKVLFDRRDPASVLWPTRRTFDALLLELNALELAKVWGEDETIGWVYQYFNSGDERRAMRDASQAPRDSRELAVRNQFFTPRYVVQFLVDNTLGRTWLEMNGGQSALAKTCEYYVSPPDPSPPRVRKDPRELRILDPACGSGHFLLYSFDLLLTIYEEGWAVPGSALGAAYPTIEALRRAIPALIVEENLHGVDIDPRAAQIAALGLWLRAQRAWKDFGIPAAERPGIRRTHIVIAEPIPSEPALLDAFASELRPPLLAALFRKMVSETRLAGEMGVLLRLERTIADELEVARKKFVASRTTTGYLPGLEPVKKQNELDLSGIDDDAFFHEAEDQIVAALHRFATSASGGASVRRRLFADDAAEGLALIELVRTKFDVVLMNPPFGSAPAIGAAYLAANYAGEKNDIYAAFVARGTELLGRHGLSGQLTSSTCFSLSHLSQFRATRLLGSSSVSLVADLGFGVLDDAAVNTAAYVVESANSTDVCDFIDARRTEPKASLLRRGAPRSAATRRIGLGVFRSLPGEPLAYAMSTPVIDLLARRATVGGSGIDVNVGMMTGDDFRYLRTWWECDSQDEGEWLDYEKGNGFARFLSDPVVCVRAKNHFAEVAADVGAKYGSPSRFIMNRARYGQAGLVYTRITVKGFSVRMLPPGQIFSGAGLAIFPPANVSATAVCAFLNSRVVEHALAAFTDGRKWEAGYVRNAPLPSGVHHADDLAELGHAGAEVTLSLLTLDETTRFFAGIPGPIDALRTHEELSSRRREILRRIDNKSLEYIALTNDELTTMTAEVGTLDEWLDREDGNSSIDFWEERWLSYLLGCAFGRWLPPVESVVTPTLDVVLAEGIPRAAPRLASNPDKQRGILVDDPGAAADVLKHTPAMGSSAPGDAAMEQRFRLWLRSTAFEQHLRLYSGCRRRAPIYWQLSTPSGGYSIWLYFSALTKDTLYRLEQDHLLPKLAHEQSRLHALRADTTPLSSPAGRKTLASQELLVAELRGLAAEVKAVTPLWKPYMEDGAIIIFALLWRLVPQHRPWQKELRAVWDALCDGDHDWAQIAMHLWPERVVPKCADDRSLAIAHGLEDVFWVEDSAGKWQKRSTPTKPVAALVAERTSAAVKAALKSLVDAPTPAAAGKARGKRAKGKS